eukprot:1863463-Prymnesium_polylepis.1
MHRRPRRRVTRRISSAAARGNGDGETAPPHRPAARSGGSAQATRRLAGGTGWRRQRRMFGR